VTAIIPAALGRAPAMSIMVGPTPENRL
jgi:hypothetical protein